ncbi:AraC family transcriptional regulator [Aureimonas altamirensis]|uniref:helix-turn-helix domain-containing protein n=1 Tax=Aureimonas altamirensis TaxID=370622 RepID=UPI0030176B4E
MFLVPLPFFVAILIVILLAKEYVGRDAEDEPFRGSLFTVLIIAYAIQSVLIGLRWGYGILAVLPAMAIMASVIAPLAFLSFRSLSGDRLRPRPRTIALHLTPAAAVAGLVMVWPAPVGLIIVVLFAAYGTALLWDARSGPDRLVTSRLDGVLHSYRAMYVTGLALLGSAASDVLIGLDLDWSGGVHAPTIIAAGNMLALVTLGVAATVARGSPADAASTADSKPAPPPGPNDTEAVIARRVEALMLDTELYKDLNLNLAKIARRLGLPPRDVSIAINRSHGMSVSQYVNEYRVRHAGKLLSETRDSVTAIMLDSGFMTKSNFNREFLRVMGMTPSAWRRAQRHGPMTSANSLHPETANETGAPKGP